MNIYNTDDKQFVKTIKLPNSERIMKDFASTDMDNVYGIQDFFEGDSLDIIYGDSLRIKSFKCRFLATENSGCPEKNNIINDGDEKWQYLREGNLYEQTYIFIKEDFENATPCNGNCD